MSIEFIFIDHVPISHHLLGSMSSDLKRRYLILIPIQGGLAAPAANRFHHSHCTRVRLDSVSFLGDHFFAGMVDFEFGIGLQDVCATRGNYLPLHNNALPVKGATPASLQSHRNWTGSSVRGVCSTPGPDTLTLLASNGGPALTRNGLLGTSLSPYLTFTV